MNDLQLLLSVLNATMDPNTQVRVAAEKKLKELSRVPG